MNMSRRTLITTAASSAVVPYAAFANAPREISWDDLIPPNVPYARIIGEGELDEENDLEPDLRRKCDQAEPSSERRIYPDAGVYHSD